MTPEWAMVIITGIYVIATIFICCANIKSANASKAQLEESKTQFEESRRLQCMPFLQMEVATGKTAEFLSEVSLCADEVDTTMYEIFRIRNLGNGTAVNMVYLWSCKAMNISEGDAAPFNAIRVGDEYYWQFTIDAQEPEYESTKVVLNLQYEDLLGNTYTQNFFITFDNDTSITDGICIETDAPRFHGIRVYSLAK